VKVIAIVFGGFSGERVISEKSARIVAQYLPKNKFEAYLVDIDRDAWNVVHKGARIPVQKDDFSFLLEGVKVRFEGVFNAIHGTPGEDGKIQGYFDMLQVPYNNCDVRASAISFSKSACNIYLGSQGVKVARSRRIAFGATYDQDDILMYVGLPCFVKPTEGGSSIGVTKVKDPHQFQKAVMDAQVEGSDVLVEAFLKGVEVSCGCISLNGKPRALAVTEIVPANEFFDFDSKYTNSRTQEITPARISNESYDQVMSQTELVYELLKAKGMIRVDFMVCEEGVFLIEPNTTPGLSEASIIPKQAAYCGYGLGDFFALSLDEMFRLHALGS
jgi:D-alanine-D-alanine ligase